MTSSSSAPPTSMVPPSSPTSGVPVNSSIVTWNAGPGRALSTNQNVTSKCLTVTVTFAGPIRTLTIRHISGANSTVTNPTQQFIYIETVTFSRRLLRLQKTSNGGVGTSNFSIPNVLNLGTTPWSSQTLATSITTATAGTAVNGAVFTWLMPRAPPRRSPRLVPQAG